MELECRTRASRVVREQWELCQPRRRLRYPVQARAQPTNGRWIFYMAMFVAKQSSAPPEPKPPENVEGIRRQRLKSSSDRGFNPPRLPGPVDKENNFA